MTRLSDIKQFEWATLQKRTIFTYNAADFHQLHRDFVQLGRSHAGIVIGDQQTLSIGDQMRGLLKIAEAKTSEQMKNQLEFLNNWRG